MGLVGMLTHSATLRLSHYKFEWDVNLEGKLRKGENDFTLRAYNPHHFGGMFQRPFLYRSIEP